MSRSGRHEQRRPPPDVLHGVRDHSPAKGGPRLDERLGGGEIAVVRGPMKCAPPEEPGKRLSKSRYTSGLEGDRNHGTIVYTNIYNLVKK